MKILFTGGGTGGHIFPIIAVCREIKRMEISDSKGRKRAFDLHYIGPKDPFGEIFLSHEGVKVKSILAGKLRRYFSWRTLPENFIDIFIKIPIGIFQAFLYIFVSSPDIIFSKGGYGSIPAVFTGWLLGIPIFLHESDVSPGLSNRILSRFATIILISFQKTEYFSLRKTALVGNPIRTEVLNGSLEEAKRIFELKGDRALILFLGGSQGSQRINDFLLNILPQLLNNFEIIHQCGDKNFKQVKAEADIVIKNEKREYYHLYPFLREKELKHAYKACDLAVCRAGSSSIFEIAAAGKPSILIPLPESAQNHQFKNAEAYAVKGAALIIEETNLTSHLFADRLRHLFSNPEKLEKMSKEAIRFSHPESAKMIAQDMIGYLLG